MKKNLLISVFTVFALMLSVNTFAQEKATKKDYKTMAKQEKVLNNELKKKALKDARKEAKKLTKEGFKTPRRTRTDKGDFGKERLYARLQNNSGE